MILYHASKYNLPIGDCLQTPTGRSDGDVLRGGAVYLTDTPEGCCRYGKVYKINVARAMPYKQALAKIGRVKKARYTRNVYVALPQDTKIIKKIGEKS